MELGWPTLTPIHLRRLGPLYLFRTKSTSLFVSKRKTLKNFKKAKSINVFFSRFGIGSILQWSFETFFLSVKISSIPNLGKIVMFFSTQNRRIWIAKEMKKILNS